jgi:hypothetical protein
VLTIDSLKNWGADVQEALVRCLNNEAFYLRLVGKALEDPSFSRLPEAVHAGDLTKAFEAAHALKGVLSNLALTPLLKPVLEITELLRSGTETDYTPLLEEIAARKNELANL